MDITGTLQLILQLIIVPGTLHLTVSDFAITIYTGYLTMSGFAIDNRFVIKPYYSFPTLPKGVLEQLRNKKIFRDIRTEFWTRYRTILYMPLGR